MVKIGMMLNREKSLFFICKKNSKKEVFLIFMANYYNRGLTSRRERKNMNELKEYTERLFEDIKHIDENENEFWYARELQMT